MTIDATFDLTAHIGRLADRMDKDAEERRRDREIQRARVPALIRLQNSVTIPTPTTQIGINFGGPDVGFEWVVRRIVVGGLTWTTTAAGTAEVYVSGLGAMWGTTGSSVGTAAGVRSLTDLVDQAASMPNKAFYGREELVVKESESLVIVINGGTAGQQYAAAVAFQAVRTVNVLAGSSQGI